MSQEFLEQLAKQLDDAPEQRLLKPDGYALAEVERAEMRDSKFADPPYPQLNVMLRCKEGVASPNGVEWVTLGAPPSGHPQFTDTDGKPTKRALYLMGQNARALAALLAPTAKGRDAQKAAILDAARAAGGDLAAAVMGKQAIIHITVNDGLDKKTGEVRSQARVDEPRNEVSTWMPATAELLAKYVGGGGGVPF